MSRSKHNKPEATAPTSAAHPFKVASRPGKLRVRYLDDPIVEVNLTNGAAVTFGRSRDADIVVSDQSVSKVHFSLRAVAAGIELEDLNSKNGTWFAGRQIRRIMLKPGDDFWAGGCHFELLDLKDLPVEVSSQSDLGPLRGESVVMRELFAAMIRLAPRSFNLLIEGETGTGKELTARTLHDLSKRANGPFVVLDCAKLPPTVAEGTIFGYCRGAFTGAERDKPGMFELANGGTLFIDEIGELPLHLQPRLLRAIDRREVSRIGEDSVVREVDVRILAATNRDLHVEAREGRFRPDLHYRLDEETLWLPPLRDRGFDVVLLAEQFLREVAETEELQPATLTDDAKTLLATYDWPGNVRELRSAMRRAASGCTDGVVKPTNIRLGRRDGFAHRLAKAMDDVATQEYDALHELVDRVYLPTVLEQYPTYMQAAEHLGLTRARLRARLKALDLLGVKDS